LRKWRQETLEHVNKGREEAVEAAEKASKTWGAAERRKAEIRKAGQRNRLHARALRESGRHPTIRGTTTFTALAPKLIAMRGRQLHSPLLSQHPHVDHDYSGQLKKNHVTRLTEEYGVREDILSQLNDMGGAAWEAKRTKAEKQASRKALAAQSKLHPKTVAKVIEEADTILSSPPAPPEWQLLQQRMAVKAKPRSAQSKLFPAKTHPVISSPASRSASSQEFLAETILRTPILGERLDVAAQYHREPPGPGRAATAQSVPSLNTLEGRRLAGKFPFYSDPFTSAAVCQVTRNPQFTAMRRMDIVEPQRMPKAQREVMGRESWHRANFASLKNEVYGDVGNPARLGYGQYPLSPHDRIPGGPDDESRWRLTDRSSHPTFVT